MRPVLLLAAAAVLVLARPAVPCSAFVVVGDGRVLFGNNEDYLDPDTFVWFVPARDGHHGAMYLGYGNRFPQGGMNDAGLAFDGFATEPRPMKEQDGKASHRADTLLAEVLETCASVEEVVAFLERIDLRPLLTSAMLFYADASGDAVIVEGDTFVRKSGDLQAVTNFYQSTCADKRAACPRYAAAMDVLEPRTETSVAVCEQALSAAAQRGRRVATVYSNVFDLRARTARLYLFHDYEHVVELSLDEELVKGEHELALPEFFPPNEAFERFAAYAGMTVRERIVARKGPQPTRAALEALAGEYDLEGSGDKTYRISLRVDGDGLVAESTIYRALGGKTRFHSTSTTEFFTLTEDTDQTLRFRLDADGRATGFVLEQGGLEYPAVRVETGRLPR